LDFCRAIFFAGLFAGSSAGPTSASFSPARSPAKEPKRTKLEKHGWKNWRIAKTGESVQNTLLKNIVGARPTAAPHNGGKR